jgi:hypothetical protein
MKTTKSKLKQIVKEELESMLAEQEEQGQDVPGDMPDPPEDRGNYDARREIFSMIQLHNQMLEIAENLQTKVYGKGYTNEKDILQVLGEIYRLKHILKRATILG